MLPHEIPQPATLDKSMDSSVIRIDVSAIKYALEVRCSESEDSSDDSCSQSDDSGDDDSELVHDVSTMSAPISAVSTAPRRPTSLELHSLSDRRASAPSQRSPHSLTPSRSLSSNYCMPPTPRTPSVSMRHDAALRSFQQKREQEATSLCRGKPRPANVNVAAIPKGAGPCIEIEQVFDDEDDEKLTQAQHEKEHAKTKRSAARKRMMSTLGRGLTNGVSEAAQQKEQKSSRRVPSLDQISSLYVARHEGHQARTPPPKTPGSASPFHHQRNLSCPSPTSPYSLQCGAVQVIVTPPTPRPQGSGSPTIGYQISGVRGAPLQSRSESACFLAPPAFDLAPGKKKAMEEQRTHAMAWIASLQVARLRQSQVNQLQRQQQQQQQGKLLSSMQQTLPSCLELMNMATLIGTGIDLGDVSVDSPTLIPGTPGAPSMVHIQQQRALLAQQQMLQRGRPLSPNGGRVQPNSPPRSAVKKPSAAATKSWWRSNTSQPTAMSRAERSDGAPRTANTLVTSSAADGSTGWRRSKSSKAESPVKIRSAGAVYVPPGKRLAFPAATTSA